MSGIALPQVDETGRQRLDPNQLALMARARELGIGVEDLSREWGCDVVRYSKGGRDALVFMGQQFPGLSAHAAFLGDHKHACKQILKSIDLPVPDGVFFFDPRSALAELGALLRQHGEVVCKPVDGTHGDGVKTGLRSLGEIEAHWRGIQDNPGGFLAEEQVAGEDLRLQAVGGQLVAACRREPAFVVGDGRGTVEELAAAHDAWCRSHNPLNQLHLDADSLALIDAAGLSPSSVLGSGERLRLKSLSNISLGGVPVDVTDDLHEDWFDAVARIGRALDLSIFSVDVLIDEPALAPERGHIIEVNVRPEWLHHTFSLHRQHDLPGMLLAELFST